MAKTQKSMGSLKKGNYIIIDDTPCKITDISTSKPGKHGSTKVRVKAVDIIENRNKELVKPSSASVDVPIIEKKTAQVLSLSGNHGQFMDMTDYSMFECTIPGELKGKISEGGEVLYWEVLGEKLIKGKK